ncbi:MAG: DUF1573 domain-containing protein [Bacteroidetes bacterium]|nr:DUF1573 domain-containing protein [Bacteroidota bacterium]MBS1630317.1 DUF1573 domain-containing protein [Bacteroidota bacterium]
MKKVILSLAFLSLLAPATFAQTSKKEPAKAEAKSSLTPENIDFKSESYDFGTVPEGPSAEHVFLFKNTGKEPIVIQRVQPSCGCTAPDWSKEPIAPGKTGMVKATYGTQGRPGHFEKTMTVFTNAGVKTVSFKGTVEQAPQTSVPENNSIMRTN